MYSPDVKLVGHRRWMDQEVLISDLEYADDLVLLATSRDALKSLLFLLEKHCCETGATINTGKTKCMAVLPCSYGPQPEPIVLRLGIDTVDVVSSFSSFGSVLSNDYSSNMEVASLISTASQAFCSLSRLLWYQKKRSKIQN